MDKNQDKTKNSFSNAWKKVGDFGKKAAEETKRFVEQTKENIHEKKAQRYTAISLSEFESDNFKVPSIIKIEDDSANREFITDTEALGWIEIHKEIPTLHIYDSFVEKIGLVFVPIKQRNNVYCKDNFDSQKYINSNQVFGKATEEKLAELSNIACTLGAKCCSVKIVEAEKQTDSFKAHMTVNGANPITSASENSVTNQKYGKRISCFEGHDNPTTPQLKWFAYDDNIKSLIEMRINKNIKTTVLELSGSSCVTMSKELACAIDDILNISGNLSMEKKATNELSNSLIYEIEF